MFDSILQFDQELLLYLNGHHAPFWDSFMWLFSGKWIWIPMYASILLVIYRNLNLRLSLLTVMAIALTITFADQVCASVIRPQVGRPRPSRQALLVQQRDPKALQLMERMQQKKDENGRYPIEKIHLHEHSPGQFYRGGSYGFPSCHAANSFALAFFLMFLFRHRRLTYFILGWAVLNSYSRIYLSVHFPGDLLVGMLVGLLGAWMLYYLYRATLRIPVVSAWTRDNRTCNQTVAHELPMDTTHIVIYIGIATVSAMLLYSAFTH